MKSKRAKEKITGNTFSATLPSGQPVDAVLDITAIRAVELAETDARERAVRAIRGFILQNLTDEDDTYAIDAYMKSFLKHYDNE